MYINDMVRSKTHTSFPDQSECARFFFVINIALSRVQSFSLVKYLVVGLYPCPRVCMSEIFNETQSTPLFSLLHRDLKYRVTYGSTSSAAPDAHHLNTQTTIDTNCNNRIPTIKFQLTQHGRSEDVKGLEVSTSSLESCSTAGPSQ